MGLIENIKPEFRVLANGGDITALVNDRLISMAYTDEAGMESDVLEIALSDHDPANPLRIPPKGAELELFMGYDGLAQRVGLFICDEIELSGEPGEMNIRARAAPYDKSPKGKANLQSQKTRSWPKGTKLGDMVAKIAKEHGLEPAVSKSLKAIPLPHIDQADESNINLLVRVAKKYDAVVKPAGGKLVLAKRGESKTVSGGQLPVAIVTLNEKTRWRMLQASRDTGGLVVAYYHATKAAKRHEVKVGSGEPVRRLKMYFPTKEMALAAAKAEHSKRERGTSTLQLSLPGRPSVVAEAKLALVGWHPDVPVDWIIKRVAHRITPGGGYTMDIEAEQPDATEAPDVQDVEG